MSNRAKEAQKKVIEEKLKEMLIYYASISGGKFPENICEDEKTYKGLVLRWMEPIIPGVDNVILIEECLGDNWSLRFDRIREQIKIFTP